MAANAALLALKAQREAQQRAEEEAFRAAMMAKFAEDDRIEQLNAQKRRLKVGNAAVEFRCERLSWQFHSSRDCPSTTCTALIAPILSHVTRGCSRC